MSFDSPFLFWAWFSWQGLCIAAVLYFTGFFSSRVRHWIEEYWTDAEKI